MAGWYVLVSLQPIMSWRWRAWPVNASCIWINLLHVSSVQFIICELALTLHPTGGRSPWRSNVGPRTLEAGWLTFIEDTACNIAGRLAAKVAGGHVTIHRCVTSAVTSWWPMKMDDQAIAVVLGALAVVLIDRKRGVPAITSTPSPLYRPKRPLQSTHRVPKTSAFFWLICQKLTDFNNFGKLNHEKIWHENLTDLPTSPVRCSHFTLGMPKSHFSTLLFMYFRLITDMLIEACGSGLLRHGLNFSTAWCIMRLISVEKDRKHILMQKVVTLNTCCGIACLTFQLPHITTGSFQSHRWQPTTGSFSASNVWKNVTNLQSDKKVLHFTSWCGDIFRWGGQVDYSLFSSEMTWIIRSSINNTAENDFFVFLKVKWLHRTGEVDKSVKCLCWDRATRVGTLELVVLSAVVDHSLVHFSQQTHSTTSSPYHCTITALRTWWKFANYYRTSKKKFCMPQNGNNFRIVNFF